MPPPARKLSKGGGDAPKGEEHQKSSAQLQQEGGIAAPPAGQVEAPDAALAEARTVEGVAAAEKEREAVAKQGAPVLGVEAPPAYTPPTWAGVPEG